MTMFTKKQGIYTPLSREQMRRFRRTDQVCAADRAGESLLYTTRALAAWLAAVQRKALRLDATDLVVTRLPNVERLQSDCDKLERALEEMRRA